MERKAFNLAVTIVSLSRSWDWSI